MSSYGRRDFLTSCARYVCALAAASPWLSKKIFQESRGRKIPFNEKWGRIETIDSNTWAHVATPFENSDYTTVSNGGIVAGDERVLVVESFNTTEGARWLAERAKELTGRWPTDVVVTHFHGDHISGAKGFESDTTPRMWVTGETKSLASKAANSAQELPFLEEMETLDANKTTSLDLGGRTAKFVPRRGHTPSDITIEVSDPGVVFCGDLVWNRMVPNYRDAMPVDLRKGVAELNEDDEKIFVPGHGPLASLEELQLFQEFLDYLEEVARDFHAEGTSVEEAVKQFALEGEFEDWFIFSPRVMPAVFNAWYRAIEEESSWTSLFDGETLSGWRAKVGESVDSESWSVEDGCLVSGKKPGELVTVDKYESFELRFDWKVTDSANSGVFYRVIPSSEPVHHTGLEYQVLDNVGQAGRPTTEQAAACYGVFGPSSDRTREVGRWNEGRIRVEGSRVEHWLNGEVVVSYDIESAEYKKKVAEGPLRSHPALAKEALGHIVLQNYHGHRVSYRDVKVRRL